MLYTTIVDGAPYYYLYVNPQSGVNYEITLGGTEATKESFPLNDLQQGVRKHFAYRYSTEGDLGGGITLHANLDLPVDIITNVQVLKGADSNFTATIAFDEGSLVDGIITLVPTAANLKMKDFNSIGGFLILNGLNDVEFGITSGDNDGNNLILNISGPDIDLTNQYQIIATTSVTEYNGG